MGSTIRLVWLLFTPLVFHETGKSVPRVDGSKPDGSELAEPARLTTLSGTIETVKGFRAVYLAIAFFVNCFRGDLSSEFSGTCLPSTVHCHNFVASAGQARVGFASCAEGCRFSTGDGC